MVHQLNQFRKSGLAYVTHDELEAALAPIRAALEVSDLDAVIDELDGGPVSGEPTEDERPALEEDPQDPAELTSEALSVSDKEAHPAESDPEGHELVAKIHEKKSRAKRKPEGQDPLGLVPDVEED